MDRELRYITATQEVFELLDYVVRVAVARAKPAQPICFFQYKLFEGTVPVNVLFFDFVVLVVVLEELDIRRFVVC